MRNQIIAFICTFCLALAWTLPMAAQENAGTQTQVKKQSPPPGTEPKPFSVPRTEKFTLPNGLQVTLVPYGAIPKVFIALSIRAGNLN